MFGNWLYLIKLAIIFDMRVLKIIPIIIFLFSLICSGQNDTNDKLFAETDLFEQTQLLPVKLKYSRKGLRKETNDSTYIESVLLYKMSDENWKSLDLQLRARGNFRRTSCYFTPLKLKIKKSDAKETIFKGHKKLKMVLPCLNENSKDDNVIKEYIIYKMYEVISPYYFNTRLLDIEFEDLKSKKSRMHELKGFLIEDDKVVAKRLNGKTSDRNFHPEGYDNLAAVRNAMFQFMIGNTDYSVSYQHNIKVMFIDKKYIPVPYDFDMAGFVNTSYSVVSQTRKVPLPIEKVTERYYMGYQRDYNLFEEIRQDFIAHKTDIISIINDHESYFDNKTSFNSAKAYIEEFYRIITDESEFKKSIYNPALKLED
jgi:hypothetical protein